MQAQKSQRGEGSFMGHAATGVAAAVGHLTSDQKGIREYVPYTIYSNIISHLTASRKCVVAIAAFKGFLGLPSLAAISQPGFGVRGDCSFSG